MMESDAESSLDVFASSITFRSKDENEIKTWHDCVQNCIIVRI